jgi:tetratricopeptide (TPR) repeat protein
MGINAERFYLAIELRDAGQLDDALQEFAELASLSPDPQDKVDLIGNQVNCLIRLGRVKEARKRWAEAEGLGRNTYGTYMDAWLSLEEGNHQEAVRKFTLFLTCPVEKFLADVDTARSIDQETYVEAGERLGRLLLDLERYAEAVPPLENALKLADGAQRKKICFYLGICEVHRKQWRAAEEKLFENLPREMNDPLWAQTQYYLGRCHFETGKLELAEQELIRSLPADREDPLWRAVQYELGRVHFHRGAYLKAKQSFENVRVP